MAESCVELDETAKRFKPASPLELHGQVTTAPRCQHPPVTAWEPVTIRFPHPRQQHRSMAGCCPSRHHTQSQEGCPDLPHSPGEFWLDQVAPQRPALPQALAQQAPGQDHISLLLSPHFAVIEFFWCFLF